MSYAFSLIGYIFFALIDYLRNSVVVIGEDNVDAHIKKALGLLGIVRPEYVAYNSVLVSLVYHLLIEIRLEKLDLFAFVSDGSFYYLPSALTRAAATAYLGIFLLHTSQKIIVSAHKVNVFFTVVFFDQLDHSAKIFGLVSACFEVNVHNTMAGELF